MKKRIFLKIIEYVSYFVVFSFLGSLVEYLFGYVGGTGIYYDRSIFLVSGFKVPFIPFYGFLFVILIAFQKFISKKKVPFYLWGFMNALIITAWELIWGLLGLKVFGHLIWDYSSHFLNFKGIISLQMTLLWFFVGYLFSFIYLGIDKFNNFIRS